MLKTLTADNYIHSKGLGEFLDRLEAHVLEAHMANWVQMWWDDQRVAAMCMLCKVPFVEREYCFVPGNEDEGPNLGLGLAMCLDCAIEMFFPNEPVPSELLSLEENI